MTALLRTGPFHEALRAAIDDSGLTLERVRDRLAARGIRVSPASLSYWQQGRSRPERADSLRAVEAIEVILGLPRSSLRALLGPPKPRGRWAGRPKEPGFDELMGPFETVGPVFTDAFEALDTRARVVSVEDRVTLRGDRSVRRVASRVVLRAVEDGADRVPAVYAADPGTDPGALTVVALENCRVGRVGTRPGTPVMAAEMLFERPLRAGEIYVMEYEFMVCSPTVSHEYRRAFRYPVGTCLMTIRFHPSAVPVRLREFSVEVDSEPRRETDISVTGGRSAYLFTTEFGPGARGVAWEWE